MSKNQLYTIMIAMLVAIVTLASLPFIQRHADSQQRDRGRAAGLALVHRFDCTYGVPFKELLASSAYASSIAAANGFEQAKHQHGMQRVSTRRLADAQLLRAADLLRQWGEVRPLGPSGLPCPPKAK